MLRFTTLLINTGQLLQQFNCFLFLSVLTFILTITGIPTATAQIPFIPTSTETSSQNKAPIFDALNRPFNCVNLQLCSNVWIEGSFQPLLTIASPPATVEQETTLPIDLRARRIQRQLNLVRQNILRRAKSNSSNQRISLNKNSAKKILLQQGRDTPIGQTLPSKAESVEINLHPSTPQIEVALEQGIPVIFLPSQEGFLKQTLLSVTQWDVIPNQALLIPTDLQQQEKIKQWREEIPESLNLSYEKREAFVLAKVWREKIREQLSDALKEQGVIQKESLFYVKIFTIIFVSTVFLSLFFIWLKRRFKVRRRKISQRLENLENSLAVDPDSSSEEIVAKAAQAEEAINAAQNSDGKSWDEKPQNFQNKNQYNLTDLPFEIVASGVESLWQYITRNALKHQTILKQQLNVMLLLENILGWMQVIIWGLGFGAAMLFYPPTRTYAGLLAASPIRIALIWIFFSIADKVVDFFIDSLLSRWATEAQQTSTTPQRYNLRVKTYSAALSQLTSVIFYGLAMIFSLSILGLSTQGLASAGVLTLIATYIFQPHIKNVIQGCLILLTDQYAVGDVVQIGSVAGFVEKMNLYMTCLRGEEGRLISIPNGNIEMVQNLTKEWSRVDFKIEIAYDADVKQALQVIQQVAEEMRREPQWQDLILEPASILGVDGITHNGILIQVWIKTQPIQQWAVGREFRLRIKMAFDQAGIAIGMPQRMLWNHEELNSKNGNSRHFSSGSPELM